MTTLQAIALGAMLAWTPSLIILAASLWDVPELEGMEKPGETTLERRLQTPSETIERRRRSEVFRGLSLERRASEGHCLRQRRKLRLLDCWQC